MRPVCSFQTICQQCTVHNLSKYSLLICQLCDGCLVILIFISKASNIISECRPWILCRNKERFFGLILTSRCGIWGSLPDRLCRLIPSLMRVFWLNYIIKGTFVLYIKVIILLVSLYSSIQLLFVVFNFKNNLPTILQYNCQTFLYSQNIIDKTNLNICYDIIKNQKQYTDPKKKEKQMFNISENYEKLWKAIIRPPRAKYNKNDVGPLIFRKSGMKIKRTQVQLTGKRGYKLIGSHYQPYNRPCKMLPCVIYLHGNSSCQLQAQNCLSSILCHDVTLFAFDFAGCGNSEGEYISLGYHQREDVDVVFNYLRSLDSVSSIGIWGRSMGAVTALMYADRNHQIGCLVLDSPFSNLEALCKQLAKRFVSNLSAFSGIALTFLSKTIKQKNNFQIQEIDPLKNVSKAFIPALFIAAKDDDFILPHHTDILYEKYSGEKQKLLVEGDHNSRRQQQVLDKISSFFYFGLCVKDLVVRDPAFIEEQKKIKKPQNSVQEQQIKGFVFHEAHYDSDDHSKEEEQLSKAMQQSLALADKKEDKKQQKKP